MVSYHNMGGHHYYSCVYESPQTELYPVDMTGS